jgi:type I restriction-modification system DNA methylase subunit
MPPAPSRNVPNVPQCPTFCICFRKILTNVPPAADVYIRKAGDAGFDGLQSLDDLRHDWNRRHIAWLQDRFPEAAITHVPGLVKVVTRKEIEAADWSLTPGRYVGVAAAVVDEDFDFEQAMTEIHEELAGLNAEAVELAETIQKNLEELGV